MSNLNRARWTVKTSLEMFVWEEGNQQRFHSNITSKKSSCSKGCTFGNYTAVLQVSHTFDPLISHLLLEGISRVITMRYCKMFSNHQQLVSLICACMPSTLEIALLKVGAVQPSSHPAWHIGYKWQQHHHRSG